MVQHGKKESGLQGFENNRQTFFLRVSVFICVL
jgi:hypothetical protein